MQQEHEYDETDPVWVSLAKATEVLETDPEKTEHYARKILKVAPGQQQALLLLVSARRARGDTTGAREALEALVQEQPRLAAAQYELGLLLGELGEREAAVRSLSRVVELEPRHPTAWRALGDALSESGDTEAAARAYLRQFESSVQDLKMLEKVTALDLDKIEIAGNMLKEFLTIYPTDVTAIGMLGQVHMRVNNYEAAEKAFARALELAPTFPQAQQDYVTTLHLQGKWDEEDRQLDKLLEQEPDNPDYLYRRASYLFRMGKYDDSVKFCEATLREYPDYAKVWLAYAYALRTVGRQEEAIAAFRRCIALEPGTGDSWWGLANLKTYRFSPADIDSMRAQLKREDLAEDDRSPLHFALGKALEDEGVYDESFEHYRIGNAVQRAQNPFDITIISRNVQRVKSSFSRDFFRAHADEGCTLSGPIFILGLARSGSTLIEQILASHSTVEGAGELPALNALAMRLEAKYAASSASGDPNELYELNSENLKALGEEYLERAKAYRNLDRPYFTDKMPNNFHHLGLICATLPNAKIIDARRHPLACCFSNFKQLFPSGRGPSYDLADIGHYYRDYVELMAHFDDILPGRVHRVIYEDMVADPKTETLRLLEYCGLPFEEKCLRFYESDRGVFTASSEQVRRPVYADSTDQWRHYDQWLGPLKDALGPVLDLYPAVPASFSS
jgi:tetratricopeptide (TPR) repeat protein